MNTTVEEYITNLKLAAEAMEDGEKKAQAKSVASFVENTQTHFNNIPVIHSFFALPITAEALAATVHMYRHLSEENDMESTEIQYFKELRAMLLDTIQDIDWMTGGPAFHEMTEEEVKQMLKDMPDEDGN